MNGPGDPFAGCEAVSLETVLALRDTRIRWQGKLRAHYQGPLITLSLNIPGPYKRFPLGDRCFEEAQDALRVRLEAEGIPVLEEAVLVDPGGYTAFWALRKSLDPREIKGLACALEAQHPAGRLFDLDVFSAQGDQISRSALGKAERCCFVCGGSAFACAHSRAHALPEIQAAVITLIQGFLLGKLEDRIAAAAVQALMGELAVTPKPGLVDRHNCGAHKDMDFFTFIDSTSALLPYFRACAAAGFQQYESPQRLFADLRRQGKIAEIAMKRATRGVNTHRGIIFSLGILSGAYGRLYRTQERPSLEDLMTLCRDMTAGVLGDFSPDKPPQNCSHGELLFRRYGMTGVRGEAAAGFPAVCQGAYPWFRRLLEAGHSRNDAGLGAFLSLLACTDDTALAHRADRGVLRRIQGELRDFLSSDPPVEAIQRKAADLDRDFIAQGISAGGCADLLGVTLFLYALNTHKT
ncbi:MAG: citrate lyase holo-[acyl-carrier protein] synthase [Spirochaetaceae bacterium]|jgi:holo-ACP synthase/triphosphoribosyl-dephospho-CoA synthase|nr:citrate lyase holo-[acyl-carrier protein] synthase [Spirochaetaceae bacterium]